MLSRKRYEDIFSAWNGQEEETGCSVSISRNGAPCTCVFDGDILRTHLFTAEQFSNVLRLMALGWDPEWGVATSHEVRALVCQASDAVKVGWVMYLAHRRGSVPPLPEPVRVEPVGEQGSLIVLTPEPFTASNPAHVDLAREVRERFDRAGLLIRPE
jgi:hypothetical protein